METKRCIFCMQEMTEEEKKCPACGKGPWQYQWKPGWVRPYTVLHDRYVIGAALGEGAFGVTYLAWDEKEEKKAAVKVYKKADSGRERELFETVGEIPGLVKKKDAFQDEGRSCLVLEYLEGGSLKAYIKKHHTIPAGEAAELLWPVMKAAAKLHSKGIVHCDISPDNLLFRGDGKLCLIDLGAAAEKDGIREEKELKPGYAPVELYQDKEKIGPWSDIYALCAVWYEMVTGRKVPSAPDRLKKDSLKPPSEYVSVPAGMEEVFLRGLSLEIQRRYFSMENMLAALGNPEREKDEEARRIWGELWIQITTEVERGSAREEKRSRAWRQAKRVLTVMMILLGAAGAGAGGLWIYARTHPEKVLAYRLKQDHAKMLTSEWKTVEMRGSKEYKEAIAYLEDHAYEVSEYEEGTKDYNLLQPAMEDWEYSKDPGECFAVKEDTAALAVETYLGEYEEKESDFFGSVHVSALPYYPISTTEWKTDTYRYGDKSVKITSDDKTGWVGEVSLRAEKSETKKYLPKFLDVLSPEAGLSEKEIQELFAYLKNKEDSVYIELNANCYLSLYLSEENVVVMDIRSR